MQSFSQPFYGAVRTTPFPLRAAQTFVNQLDYGDLENLILQYLDNLDGIQTSLETIDQVPVMVRDATKALPLEKRLAPEDPLILKGNLLLRALGAVRGIDQVLKFQFEKYQTQYLEMGRVKLKLHYQHLILTLITEDTDNKLNLKTVQTQFNTQLIELLHEMKLDAGIDNVNTFKKLLAHYRNLATLIEPAKALKTITKHILEDVEITQTEISIPITHKTAEQKHQIDVMKKIIPRQPEIYNDFHSSKKVAFQLVNQAFCELLKMDDRRLPAQSRLTIGPTVKNGYVVTNRCDFKRGAFTTSMQFTTLRSGTLVYVGEDDSKLNMNKYAVENLIQLLAAGGNKNLHMTMLLTDTILKQQDVMIKTTKTAIATIEEMQSHASAYFSYIPVNFQGSAEKAEISTIIAELGLQLPTQLKAADFMNRQARLEYAAQVINLFFNVTNFINVTTCASGQDRTGTALEAATQLWIFDQYQHLQINVTKADIEMQRAVGCHNAVLASFAVPGSPGMKNDSRVRGYFSALTDQYFYRSSAQTNKLPELDDEVVQMLLNTWLDKKTIVYENAIFQIENAHSETAIQIGLLEWVEMVAIMAKEKKLGELLTQHFLFLPSIATSAKRAELISILFELEIGIKENKADREFLANLSRRATELNVNAHPASLSENLNLVLVHLNEILKQALLKLTAISHAQTIPSPSSSNLSLA